MRSCDEILARTLEMAASMLSLADEGDGAREDVGCGILYGVLRDSAYKIRRLAEQERVAHIRKGWWREEPDGSNQQRRGLMAEFECSRCGHTREGRCKPQTCPQCGEKKSFEKKDA